MVGAEYRVKDGDVVTHHVHRHEPPVTGQKVEVLASYDGLLVCLY